MSTDDPNQTQPNDSNQLADLVDTLQSVDTTTPQAALNATSKEYLELL